MESGQREGFSKLSPFKINSFFFSSFISWPLKIDFPREKRFQRIIPKEEILDEKEQIGSKIFGFKDIWFWLFENIWFKTRKKNLIN